MNKYKVTFTYLDMDIAEIEVESNNPFEARQFAWEGFKERVESKVEVLKK